MPQGPAANANEHFNSATPACAWRPRKYPRTRILICRTSIRPRLLARGDSSLPARDCSQSRTSIRPRLLARGDVHAGRIGKRVRRTSIRPRLLARGDVRVRRCTTNDLHDFNSATPACAWRHLSGVVHAWSRANFNSATPACAWRRNDLGATHQNPTYFNSATPACAWRRECITIRMGIVPITSIRPRLLARGDNKAKRIILYAS